MVDYTKRITIEPGKRSGKPCIRGLRITVYDVMDYWKEGWQYDQIAGLFRLPPDEIQAAIQYIEEHKTEVETDYQQILERHRNVQYSPEVQKKLAQNRENFQRKLEEFRARRL